MYAFPKEMKEALERCEASFVCYQKIEDKAVPVTFGMRDRMMWCSGAGSQ